MHYYNEFDPHHAQWLRNLIADGRIPKGEVDDRSIVDVTPGDVAGFTQCHWFAGIGGWAEGLRLAGWDERRPAWTGSCPCQPFSQSGFLAGEADPRHLWPAWFKLIRACRPGVVFGEQVENAINLGWLDRVCDDLEREGYAVEAGVLPAACVGSPQPRHRLFWVADADGGESGVSDVQHGWQHGLQPQDGEDSFWSRFDTVTDGKERWRVEPGSLVLVDGLSFLLADGRTDQTRSRLKMICGMGNAIVPQVAAEFVRAYLDV